MKGMDGILKSLFYRWLFKRFLPQVIPYSTDTMRFTFCITSLLASLQSLFIDSTTATSLPGCQTLAPPQPILSSVRTANISVPGNPFGLVYATLQKDTAFVSLEGSSPGNSTIGVLDTSSFPPALLYQIPLPTAYVAGEGAFGLALSRSGTHLFVAAGPGLVVLDTALAASGNHDAVVGTLNGTTPGQQPGTSAIEVTLSQNDYAFVSQEYGAQLNSIQGNIDVFSINNSSANGTVSGSPIGFLSLGQAVVGTSLSPHGDLLYATSESVAPGLNQGSLSVLNITILESNPATALTANTSAGCQPVRTLLSGDGSTIWVTARASNYLLAFNTSALLLNGIAASDSNTSSALLASVQVGTLPVGLAFVRNETRILTADSNRNNVVNATTGLSVVDTAKALAGEEGAVLGRIETGLFPREFGVSLDGRTVLVADYDSKGVQAVDVSTVP